MDSEQKEKLHVLLGDLRQLASDLITFEHHGREYPEPTPDQWQDLRAGQSALNELYWHVFGSERVDPSESNVAPTPDERRTDQQSGKDQGDL